MKEMEDEMYALKNQKYNLKTKVGGGVKEWGGGKEWEEERSERRKGVRGGKE